MKSGLLKTMYSPVMTGVNVVMLLGLTCDPVLTRLFTPLHPQLGHYEVCTTGEPLAAIVQADHREWAIEDLEPLEAFGAAGMYDRSALTRLYGGRHVKVARGWTEAKDRFESVTLLSPYPDASFTQLQDGTMLIRWTLSR